MAINPEEKIAKELHQLNLTMKDISLSLKRLCGRSFSSGNSIGIEKLFDEADPYLKPNREENSQNSQSL